MYLKSQKVTQSNKNQLCILKRVQTILNKRNPLKIMKGDTTLELGDSATVSTE